MTGQVAEFSKGVLDRARGLVKDLKVDGLDLRLSPIEQVDVFVERYVAQIRQRAERMSLHNRVAIVHGTEHGKQELAKLNHSLKDMIELVVETLVAAMIAVIYHEHQFRRPDEIARRYGRDREGRHWAADQE